MDNRENASRPSYISEYRRVGNILGKRGLKDRTAIDKALQQVFLSLIILAFILLINAANISLTKAITKSIKSTLNWQIDISSFEKIIKVIKLPKEEKEDTGPKDFEVLDAGISKFIMPLEGEVTSLFGERKHPVFNTVKQHNGIDINGEYGDEIMSSMDGTVEEIDEDINLGKFLRIKNGIYDTLYGHCSKITAKEGQKVKQGDKIAEVGDTGYASGTHLHFEIWIEGIPVNPIEMIK